MNHNQSQRRSEYTIKPIAYIVSDYNEKFGIPRQCGLVDELEQAIVFEPEFSNIDAVRGLEGFSYIWLIWGFSENVIDMSTEPVKWSPLVRPPRLGGNVKKGVWASRSPYRPNSLGLSSVRLERIVFGSEVTLFVKGADLMNGTPIFDIKPYIPYSDSHPDARAGFTEGAKDDYLDVIFPDELLSIVDEERRDGLMKVLRLDPRGAYEKKDGHVYGLSFANWDIRFSVSGNRLSVIDVLETENESTGIRTEARRIK